MWHSLFNDLPDISGIFLAAFGAALMFFPEAIKKLEGKRFWRGLLFVVCIALGIVGVISGHLQRADSDKQQAELRNRIGELEKRQHETNEGVTQANAGIAVIQHTMDEVKPIPGNPSHTAQIPSQRARLHIFKTEILTPGVGKPIYLNVFFENTGTLTADMQGYQIVGYVPNTGDVQKEIQAEDDLAKQLPAVIKKGGSISHNILPGQKVWSTDTGPLVASEDQLKEVTSAKYIFFFIGVLMYRDTHGQHETRYCVFNNGSQLIFQCRKHNAEN